MALHAQISCLGNAVAGWIRIICWQSGNAEDLERTCTDRFWGSLANAYPNLPGHILERLSRGGLMLKWFGHPGGVLIPGAQKPDEPAMQ